MNDTHTKEAFEAAKFIGIVGFGAGFIGSFFVHPGSSQGPLFGIIISGPLSFVFGLFISYLPAIFSPLKKIRPDVLKSIGAIMCFAVTAMYLSASK
jgi:hypothetical protein